ncbi:hypothetical protein D5R81_13120 [Parashewanella spongiae]|uniref:Uncharacterized protein n=1 Tax=Parashewanella spongiae TaxID=342950 RepID=A0A3A6TLX9_9GAMM|nr:hypothetical protein [Parashewanella spongiae]MCL1080155.1 hypothetical protein [Parashewanella spongiae]RJY11490.1 hypothetical protein D5R81_13120 [Parashewanella spongiae]
MGYKERSVWASLLILGYIWYDYFIGIFNSVTGDILNVELVNELLFNAVVMTIILEVALPIVIAIIDDKDADYTEDERDKSITYKATVPAYNVLYTGVILAIFYTIFPTLTTYTFPNSDLPNDYFVLNIIIVFALAAEVVRFMNQIKMYRKGF